MHYQYHIHDRALEQLICDMLRSTPYLNITRDQSQYYSYQVGLALHNLPHYLRTDNAIPDYELTIINTLDPTGSETKWGDWVTKLYLNLGNQLPELHRKQNEWPAHIGRPSVDATNETEYFAFHCFIIRIIDSATDAFNRAIHI